MTMPSDPNIDPLQAALSALTPVQPREFHAHQVRRRCRAALARQRVQHGRPARVGAAELLMASAVVLYVAAAVVQALQLAGGLS